MQYGANDSISNYSYLLYFKRPQYRTLLSAFDAVASIPDSLNKTVKFLP